MDDLSTFRTFDRRVVPFTTSMASPFAPHKNQNAVYEQEKGIHSEGSSLVKLF